VFGEVDEPGECTEDAIRELLLKHGYRELAAAIDIPDDKPVKRKYERHVKPVTVKTPDSEPVDEAVQVEEAAAFPEVKLPPGSDTLTADDLQQLVFALYIQSKAGIPGAKEKLNQILLVLFS